MRTIHLECFGHIFSWRHLSEMHLVVKDASSWMHFVEAHLHKYVHGCIFRFRYGTTQNRFDHIYFTAQNKTKKHYLSTFSTKISPKMHENDNSGNRRSEWQFFLNLAFSLLKWVDFDNMSLRPDFRFIEKKNINKWFYAQKSWHSFQTWIFRIDTQAYKHAVG